MMRLRARKRRRPQRWRRYKRSPAVTGGAKSALSVRVGAPHANALKPVSRDVEIQRRGWTPDIHVAVAHEAPVFHDAQFIAARTDSLNPVSASNIGIAGLCADGNQIVHRWSMVATHHH